MAQFHFLQQVFAVLKSTLDKLMLVGMIEVDPKVQAQELTQSVGEEITKMIAAQKELERRFEELVSAQHTLRNLPNKTKLRENQVSFEVGAPRKRSVPKWHACAPRTMSVTWPDGGHVFEWNTEQSNDSSLTCIS